VGAWLVAQIYKASKLVFSDIYRIRRLGLSPRSSCAGVVTGLLKLSRKQLWKNRQIWHSNNTCLKHIQNHNFSTSWTQKQARNQGVGPLQNFSLPLERCAGHSFKNLGPSQKILRPAWRDIGNVSHSLKLNQT